jgi:monofunctional biosynthetic peptidoglycan transglycosylase
MKKKSYKFRRRLIRRLATWLLALLLVSWIPVIALRWLPPPVTAFMLHQNPDGQFTYQWMNWNRLGDKAALAVVAAEDQKFPLHHGFDTAAIRTALADRLDGKPLRGASTISQQLAKNLFLWPDRNLGRKALEAWFTLLIELSWSKQRILEAYLNVAEFGDGLYGLPAASRHYFGLEPRQINDAQAALLAAALPNPSILRVDRPSPYMRERQQWILTQMTRLRRAHWLSRITS